MTDKIIKLQNLYAMIDIEPLVLLFALLLLAWVFYRFFLKEVSLERHNNLQNHFRNLYRHFAVLSALYALTALTIHSGLEDWALSRALPYIALLTVLWGVVVFVKVSRLIILQYLFLGSMKAGVPVLIVNIYSLVLTVLLLLWGASNVFGLQLGPLLATSAAFSVIMGLALQDTLGNLFAGIALQIDHTFEIGDWLEINLGTQKVVGQVKEITWRATVFSGWFDEVITIPNRSIANSQISNFQSGDQPIARGLNFKLPPKTNIDLAKKAAIAALKDVSGVRANPAPFCYISELGDSWINLRVTYSIDHFGSQYVIGDQVFDQVLRGLRQEGIDVTAPTFLIQQKS